MKKSGWFFVTRGGGVRGGLTFVTKKVVIFFEGFPKRELFEVFSFLELWCSVLVCLIVLLLLLVLAMLLAGQVTDEHWV